MKAKLLPSVPGISIPFVLFLVMMTGFIIQGVAQTVVTPPAGTWTVPANVTSVKVEVWGGGGGGGGASGWILASGAGGGGGGGAYKTSTLTVISGQTYTITIGTGGTAGGGGATGGNGGTTTVSGSGSTVTATGGSGGGGGNSNNGSGGAASTGGTFNGGAGGASGGNGAGGGGGAGNNGNGNAGGNIVTGTGGTGSPNSAPYIGGTGGAYQTGSGTGNIGAIPGGGGGGGRYAGIAGSNNGGAGGAGQVVLTYTVCIPPTAYTLTGGGVYCLGDAGKNVGLSNSQTGVNYQLKLNGTATGAPVAGTGAALDFGIKTAGTYTVEATRINSICSNTMTGNAIVIQNNQVVATINNQKDISCFAGNDGQITVLASGGISPYTFSVDNGLNFLPATGADVRVFTGLQANTPYKVMVKDFNGCTSPAIP